MTKGLLYVESEPGELPVEEYQDCEFGLTLADSKLTSVPGYDNEHVPLRMDNKCVFACDE